MTIAEPSTVLMGKTSGLAASPRIQPGITAIEQNMAFASLQSSEGLSPESSSRREKRSSAHITELLAMNDIRPSKRKAGNTGC